MTKEVKEAMEAILADFEHPGSVPLEPKRFKSQGEWFFGTAPIKKVRLGNAK